MNTGRGEERRGEGEVEFFRLMGRDGDRMELG